MINKNLFNDAGNIINNILHLSPKEAYNEGIKGATFLDLRRQAEIAYKGFDVPNIIFSSPSEVKENFENLPKDQPIIIVDNAGTRSKQIAEFLTNKNYENVANMVGGMFEWDKFDLPIKLNNKERLSGSCLCMLKPMGKVRKD